MKYSRTTAILLPVLGAVLPGSSVQAWGTTGHQTIVYIASDLISASTRHYAQGIMNDTSEDFLAKEALWADSYRYTAAGKFSSPFHYIDANDNPPARCDVDYDRDCAAEGCIISALANYTARVQDESLPAAQRQDALRFVIHFAGDAHQPLHVEALDVGGNDIDVEFDGQPKNLHSVWDTSIVDRILGDAKPSLPGSKKFAANLTAEIRSGAYSNETQGWLAGMDIDDVEQTTLGWARGANKLVCSAVIPDGVSAVENKDLSGDYYASNVPVVKKQLAQAGYRLAAWLNLIATGNTGFEAVPTRTYSA